MKSTRVKPDVPTRDLSVSEVAYLLRWFGPAWRLNNRLLAIRLRRRDVFRRHWYLEHWDMRRGEATFSCYPERAFNRCVPLDQIESLAPAAAPEIVAFALGLQSSSRFGF
jgi:hypothetical protein